MNLATAFEALVISLVSQILSAVLGIAVGQAKQAEQATLIGVDDAVIFNRGLLEDGTFGLDAILVAVQAVATAVTALGSPQQATSPVTLPSTPPSGYGGASSSDVWGYVMPVNGVEAAVALDNVYTYSVAQGSVSGYSVPTAPYFACLSGPNISSVALEIIQYPRPAIANIVVTDTVTTWLTRELVGWTILGDIFGNGLVVVSYPGDPAVFQCQIDGPWFDKLQYYLYTPSSGPPQRSTEGDTNQLLALIPLQY